MSTFNMSSIKDLVLKMEDGTEIKLNVSEILSDCSVSRVETKANEIALTIEDLKPYDTFGFDVDRDKHIIELLVDDVICAKDEVKSYLVEAILNNMTIVAKGDEIRGIGKSTLMCHLSKLFQIPIVFRYSTHESLYKSLGAYTIDIDDLTLQGNILRPRFILVDDLCVHDVIELKQKGITPIGVTYIPKFI